MTQRRVVRCRLPCLLATVVRAVRVALNSSTECLPVCLVLSHSRRCTHGMYQLKPCSCLLGPPERSSRPAWACLDLTAGFCSPHIACNIMVRPHFCQSPGHLRTQCGLAFTSHALQAPPRGSQHWQTPHLCRQRACAPPPPPPPPLPAAPLEALWPLPAPLAHSHSNSSSKAACASRLSHTCYLAACQIAERSFTTK